MKGNLELFQNRLVHLGQSLPGGDALDMEAVFMDFEAALGSQDIPFYDVTKGQTLADYYQGQFIPFAKKAIAEAQES